MLLECLSKELAEFRELCLMASNAWAVLKQRGLKWALGNSGVWKSVGVRICDKVMEKERVPTAAAQSCFPGVGKACARFRGRPLIIIIMLLASNKCFSSPSCSDVTQQHVTSCGEFIPTPQDLGQVSPVCLGQEGVLHGAAAPRELGPGSCRRAGRDLQGNSALPASKAAELCISDLNLPVSLFFRIP